MGKGNIIVFAPHPDDETFGCGGTIAKKISEGYEVFVVIMTDGRYAFKQVLGIDNDPAPEVLKEIRKEEVKKATRILGIPESNLIFLDFVDGTLKDNEVEAEERVIEILREINPCELYIPYKRDGHPDHRETYKIVKRAIDKQGISPLCYKYSITHKFARLGRFFDPMLNFLFRVKKVQVDISDFVNIKKHAIEQFKSEINSMFAWQHKPIIINVEKFEKEKETFYL
jgi:LmbE family N-acetylglucosaminyl deacetylase